jgi:DNA-binding NarL/FixJ family response regulator
VAKLLIKDYLTRVERGEESSYDTLSDREREILKLIAEGRTNKEIAEMLFLSIKTIQAHRANLMRKLGMHDRTELVKYAIRKGIIGLDEA